MSTDIECDGCGEVFGDEDEFELHPCPANPANRDSLALSVAFPGCEHTLRLMTGKTLPERCPACATGILPGQTRCEDFPCCGHTDGGGCMPRPEHTSEYWSRLMSTMDPDDYDAYIERMDEQERGY